jgi:pimeloyl-ACP methyl ester carboxylesterase
MTANTDQSDPAHHAVTVPVIDPSIDPNRFEIHRHEHRGITQSYVREGVGGVPLVLVHGWPETMRVWWKVIAPLSAAGFEVIVPDLRGFGTSTAGDFGDVPAHSRDLHSLVHDHLGLDRVVLCGGDLGGPVMQDAAARHDGWVDRMVLFNSPLPYDKVRMAGLKTRASIESADYYIRQGTDADALAAELSTPAQRRRYIATFYTSRFWAHPGGFSGAGEVDFHVQPFDSHQQLRAGFRAYESVFDAAKRSEPPMMPVNHPTRTLILFGPSDHVIYPDFDRMAEVVFVDRVGPFLLRDCGHFVPWEAPERLVSATVAFCGDLLR